MTLFKYFASVILIVVGVLLLMVLGDLINPQTIELTPEQQIIHYYQEIDLVYDEDRDDWAESANALGIHPDSMTFEQFKEHAQR
jgi:hypothetical protein